MAATSVCGVPLVHDICGAAGGAVSSIGKDFIQTAATDAAQGADSLLSTLATSWTQIPTPTGSNCTLAANGAYNCVTQSAASGGTGGAIQFIQGDLRFITLFVGVFSIIFAAARMAYLRRGEPMREATSGLLRLVLVSGIGLAFISIMAQAGDSFSAYVLKSTPSSKSGDLAQATTLFKLSGGSATIGPFLLLILGILAILATLVQLFLIVVRGALLVVIAGVWPLSAAASMTGGGKAFFSKTTGYLIAFLIYKPAAAVVYALAFYLIQNPPANEDPIIPQIEGVTLIILATLTLPALLKFVVPAVASVGGISTAEVAGAGLALATGAAAIIGTGGAAAAGAGTAGSAGAAGPAGAGAAGGKAGAAGMSTAGNTGEGGGAEKVAAGSGGGQEAAGSSSSPPAATTGGGGSPGGGSPGGGSPGGGPFGSGGTGRAAQGWQQLGKAARSGPGTASGAADEQLGGEPQ